MYTLLYGRNLLILWRSVLPSSSEQGMDAILSFKISSYFYQTLCYYISDGSIFHNIPLGHAQLKINAPPPRMKNCVIFSEEHGTCIIGLCPYFPNTLHGTEDCGLYCMGEWRGAVLKRRMYIKLCNSYLLLTEIKCKNSLHVIIFLMWKNYAVN